MHIVPNGCRCDPCPRFSRLAAPRRAVGESQANVETRGPALRAGPLSAVPIGTRSNYFQAIVYPLGSLYCAFRANLDECEVQPPLQDSFRTVPLKQTLKAVAFFSLKTDEFSFDRQSICSKEKN